MTATDVSPEQSPPRLGLDRTMVSSMAVPARMAEPGVGGVFETEPEITELLDTLGPDLIGFGPDPGHLCLAGTDPVARKALRGADL